MIKIENLDEIKKIELGILISFDKFCRNNDIKYSLGAGTMIGAVRHGGFIPWDDDIDIFMLRKEYDTFLKLVAQNNFTLDETFYTVLNPENKENIHPFIKIVDTRTIAYEQNRMKKYMKGIWMDIFPVDCVGDDEKEIIKIQNYMRKNGRRLMQSIMRYEEKGIINFLKNIYLLLVQTVGGYTYSRYKSKILNYKLPKEGKFCGPIIWTAVKGKNLQDVYPKECFESYSEADFENRKFMIFSKYDEILKHRYGDYMKLPSEKYRYCHEINAYYIEDDNAEVKIENEK